MNKAIITLAILTAGFIYATFSVVFSEDTPHGYVNKMAASAIGGIEGLFTELPPPVKAVAKEKKMEVATTTEEVSEDDIATTTEEKIDVSNWRIFYTPTHFDGANAYTLRYPPKWVMHDNNPRSNILMHEVDGFIYHLTFNEDAIDLSGKGRFGNATTTMLGDMEYKKYEAVQAGTTTLVAYIPQGNYKSFKVAFGSVPPSKSSEYVKIYERILDTLAIEPANYFFEILNVRVDKKALNLTTNTSIAEPASLSWRIRKGEDFKASADGIDVWVEDSDGKKLTSLGSINTDTPSPAEFKLPPLCLSARVYSSTTEPNTKNCIKKSDITFGKQYRVVMVGDESNKAYSNWFIIYDDKQFAGQELSVKSMGEEPPLTVEISASITGRANPNDRYIVFFSDGEFSELANIAPQQFRGKWLRTYTESQAAEQKVYLMRTSSKALESRLYGASTIEAIQTYADIILERELKLLK